ncbi:MAG: hypothetical protein ACF8MF_02915 [Phycisphaerales bacterium JB052]
MGPTSGQAGAWATGLSQEVVGTIEHGLSMVPRVARRMQSMNRPGGRSQIAGGQPDQATRILGFVAELIADMYACSYDEAMLRVVVGLADYDAEDAQDERHESFADRVIEVYGHIDPEEIDQLRSDGFQDRQIADIVSVVALTMFACSHIFGLDIESESSPHGSFAFAG